MDIRLEDWVESRQAQRLAEGLLYDIQEVILEQLKGTEEEADQAYALFMKRYGPVDY